MKKRWISTALCAAMVAGSLAGCGLKSPDATTAAPAATEAPTEAAKAEGDAAEESKTEAADTEAAADTSDMPEVTLVMAEVNPLDTIVGQTDSKFKETVEEMSGGKIKIDLQASGVLGSENDVLDTMLGGGGTIDISRISAFALTSYGAEKSVLLSIPYTFANRDHFWKFADSELAPEFLMEPHDNGLGVRGLYYGEEGFRHFFTVKEVKGLDDLKGMKLRVSTDPVMVGTVEALGANATVVAFNELYSALQTGVVDGAEQPAINYKANAFHEVAGNMILDGHQMGIFEVVITDDAWNNKLTEAQRECVMEASKYASEYCRQISEEAEAEVMEELKAAGVHIVEVEDKTPWQDACKDVIADASKEHADLYQKILDLAK